MKKGFVSLKPGSAKGMKKVKSPAKFAVKPVVKTAKLGMAADMAKRMLSDSDPKAVKAAKSFLKSR